MSASVISTYGLEMSSPTTSTRTPPPVAPSAMSSAVRYWLETSPRTRTVAPARRSRGAIASGG